MSVIKHEITYIKGKQTLTNINFGFLGDDHNTASLFCLLIFSMEETQHTSTPNKKMVNAKCQSSDHRTEQDRTECIMAPCSPLGPTL